MNLRKHPYYDEEIVDVVSKVLRSGKINYWTGNEVKSFEKEFAEYIGTKYAIAVCNGTVTLEMALRVLGIGEGDEVLVTSRTFVASASTILQVGAKPVFCDVDLDTQNISMDSIKDKYNHKTKAIICVHLAGYPCDMDEIMKFANENYLYVIEDCAQCHGGMYKGRKLGSIGHINSFSFCQDKIMSTGGEGGMLTLNEDIWYKKLWSYKDHGKDYDLCKTKSTRYVHTTLGTNYRMTEMQASIGRVLLKRLDEYVKLRRKNAKFLTSAFRNIPLLRIPELDDDNYHAYYKYYVFINEEYLKEGWNRDRIVKEINESGIPCYTGSCSEVYKECIFDDNETLPNAKILGDTSIMFLVHPTLQMNDLIQMVIKANKVFITSMKT